MQADNWKVRRPTAKWACLTALAMHPLPHTTAHTVHGIVNRHGLAKDGKSISEKNAESRLCELVRLKLATSHKHDGDRLQWYLPTERGLKLLDMGEDGMALMRILSAKISALDDMRAVAMAPAVEEWTAYIEQRLAWESDRLLGS